MPFNRHRAVKSANKLARSPELNSIDHILNPLKTNYLNYSRYNSGGLRHLVGNVRHAYIAIVCSMSPEEIRRFSALGHGTVTDIFTVVRRRAQRLIDFHYPPTTMHHAGSVRNSTAAPLVEVVDHALRSVVSTLLLLAEVVCSHPHLLPKTSTSLNPN